MILMTPMQGTDAVVFGVNAPLQVERSCLRLVGDTANHFREETYM